MFTTLNKVPFYYLALVLLLITCVVIHRVSRSWFGNVLWSIREGDLLASSVGVNVPGSKLIAFIVSAFFAGLAGSLYATYFGYISPLVFTFEYSVNVLIYIVVGGFSSFAGPILGAVVLTLVPELFRVTGKYQNLIFGLILVASMLTMPQRSDRRMATVGAQVMSAILEVEGLVAAVRRPDRRQRCLPVGRGRAKSAG